MSNNIRKYDEKINFDDFELVPYPINNIKAMAINISESGNITLNQAFIKEIKTLKVRFSASKYKRLLLIDTINEPNYEFNKSGSKHDPDFCKSLCKHNIKLPARYEVYFSEEDKMWVGKLVKANKKSKLEKAVEQSIKSR